MVHNTIQMASSGNIQHLPDNSSNTFLTIIAIFPTQTIAIHTLMITKKIIINSCKIA